MTDTLYQDMLAQTEEAIRAALVAETEIMTGLNQSYTIDTGQSRQTVTKVNITELRKYIEALISRRAMLRKMLGLDTTYSIGAPGW